MKKQRKKRFKIWHGLLAVVLIGGIIVLSSPTIGTWVQGQFSLNFKSIDYAPESKISKTLNFNSTKFTPTSKTVEPVEVKLKSVDLTNIEADISLETRLKNAKEGEKERRNNSEKDVSDMHIDAETSSERSWIISAVSNNRDCPYISGEAAEEASQRLNNLVIATETLSQYFWDDDSEYNNNALVQLSDALSTFKLSHLEFVDFISPIEEGCVDNRFIMKAFPILKYTENMFTDGICDDEELYCYERHYDSTVLEFIEEYIDLLDEYVNSL